MKKSKLLSFFLSSLLVLPVVGLAHENSQRCSVYDAYAAGISDANHDKSRNISYSRGCENLLDEEYNKGYDDALSNTEHSHHGEHKKPDDDHDSKYTKQCIDHFGEQICGYDCKKNVTNVMCAPKPGQQCIAGSFDEIACGYSCVKSGIKIKCATRKKYNCVVGNFDEIKCGTNCRMSFGHVECDEYDLNS